MELLAFEDVEKAVGVPKTNLTVAYRWLLKEVVLQSAIVGGRPVLARRFPTNSL